MRKIYGFIKILSVLILLGSSHSSFAAIDFTLLGVKASNSFEYTMVKYSSDVGLDTHRIGIDVNSNKELHAVKGDKFTVSIVNTNSSELGYILVSIQLNQVTIHTNDRLYASVPYSYLSGGMLFSGLYSSFFSSLDWFSIENERIKGLDVEKQYYEDIGGEYSYSIKDTETEFGVKYRSYWKQDGPSGIDFIQVEKSEIIFDKLNGALLYENYKYESILDQGIERSSLVWEWTINQDGYTRPNDGDSSIFSDFDLLIPGIILLSILIPILYIRFIKPDKSKWGDLGIVERRRYR